MKLAPVNIVLLVLMLAASGLAPVLRPTHKLADTGLKVNLETMIPEQFGSWHLDRESHQPLINPQASETLGRIYAQLLSRTYINAEGYRIMLSIPYGPDQSDNLAVHDPEGCYPAQGFGIMKKSRLSLQTGNGSIPVRRMETKNGSRYEPVTYWSTVGDKAVNNDIDRKLAQLTYIMRGTIPDGILFRVSSIDNDPVRAYSIHGEFINAMQQATSPEARKKIFGLD